MVRIIKFRGISANNSFWKYGDLTRHNGEICLKEDDIHYRVKEETIGQYTGLYDKHDVEIYEGDIIRVKGKYNRVVIWDNLGWAIIPTQYYNETDECGWRTMNIQHPSIQWWIDYDRDIEIIGNIYENKELLQ